MRIGYVCTSLGTVGFTEAALRTLHAQRGRHEVHAVVVDNGSTAEEVARLREAAARYPHVEVLAGHGNIGYFPGLNLGIERLRASRPDLRHVVAGNNDLEFPEDFVDTLERHREVLDRWMVVSPDLVTPNGVHQNPHVRIPISRGRRAVWAAYYAAFPLARAIAWVAKVTHRYTARPERVHGARLSREAGPMLLGYGACYLLGPRFFERFDRLYGPSFLMFEEYFLSVQLAVAGEAPYYEPGIVVRHMDHATIARMPGRRLWELSRASYATYLAHERMTATERGEAVERATRRVGASAPAGSA